MAQARAGQRKKQNRKLQEWPGNESQMGMAILYERYFFVIFT